MRYSIFAKIYYVQIFSKSAFYNHHLLAPNKIQIYARSKVLQKIYYFEQKIKVTFLFVKVQLILLTFSLESVLSRSYYYFIHFYGRMYSIHSIHSRRINDDDITMANFMISLLYSSIVGDLEI